MSSGKNVNKVRVAVIGGGNMGGNHLRNYFLLPEFELVALADPNPKTKSLADEYRAAHFTDYKKMLDEIRPEAVSVVVPTPLHAEVATEVIQRGIHCLLEKPIASTVEEAERMIKLAKKQSVVFTVGHIERYNPLIRSLKSMLDDKMVGEVSSIVCKRVGGFPSVEPKTDVIIDLAVHDIDIISYLLGQQPKKIFGHSSRTHHSSHVDSAEILMDYGHASGFIQANWLTPVKIRTIAITGSGGYVEGNYITQELEYYQHNMQNVSSFSNLVVKMGDAKKERITVDFEEPLAVELKSLFARIRGNISVRLVEPEDAKEALRLALEAVRTK
jgi:UDP-N-acetylglucosamine 3-dehydrogenase